MQLRQLSKFSVVSRQYIRENSIVFFTCLPLKCIFVQWVKTSMSLFCIQAEIMLQETIDFCPDVGKRGPVGLAWSLNIRYLDIDWLTVTIAYSQGRKNLKWIFTCTQTQTFKPIFKTIYLIKYQDRPFPKCFHFHNSIQKCKHFHIIYTEDPLFFKIIFA